MKTGASDIRGIIRDIAKNEKKAAGYFDLKKLPPWKNPSHRSEIFKHLIRLNANGGEDRICDHGAWVPGVNLIWQLTIQRTLLVDIEPLDLESFVRRYGVTPDQMRQLAIEGFVIPSLYMYESDKKEKFRRHIQHADVIRPILYEGIARCRINGLRVSRFLDELLGRTRRKAAKEEAKLLFTPALSTMTKEQLQTYTRSDNVSSAMTRVERNWEYMVAFENDEDQGAKWVADTRTYFREYPTDINFAASVLTEQLPAMNCFLASPYTAAFGGTHNMGKFQLDSLFKADPIVRVSARDKGRRRLSEEEIAGIEFVASIGLGRTVLNSREPDYNFVFPSPLDDPTFTEFISWRREMSSELERAEQMLRDLRLVANDKHMMVDTACDHWKIIEHIRRSARRVRKLREILSNIFIASGIAAFSAEILLNIPHLKPEWESVLAHAGKGGATLALATRTGVAIIESMLRQQSRRTVLVDYWDNLAMRGRPSGRN